MPRSHWEQLQPPRRMKCADSKSGARSACTSARTLPTWVAPYGASWIISIFSLFFVRTLITCRKEETSHRQNGRR